VIGVMLTGRKAQEVLGILRETSNTLPPEVKQVLQRATDEKPENRHASVKGLVTDFTGAVKEVEGQFEGFDPGRTRKAPSRWTETMQSVPVRFLPDPTNQSPWGKLLGLTGAIRLNKQKRKFQFFLVIGLFLSVCFGILKYAISLPSWMGPLVPLLLITAFVALLILVEGIEEVESRKEEDTPTNPRRRAFFNRLKLPASSIGLLILLGGFLTIEAFDAQRESQLTQLRIGFDPIGNNPGGVLDTSALNNDLSNLLGMPVTAAYVGKTYTDTVNALGEGNIEVGWLSPMNYLYAHQKYGAKAILRRLTREGQKTYQCYIITKKNTGIRKMSDLKDRRLRFAFVDPYSTSGNLVPRYELKKNFGLDPDKDINGFYAGSQEEVIQRVLNGYAAAGAVSSDNYNAYQGSDLIIMYISPVNIPEGPIAVSKDLQRYDTLLVEDAFLSIGEIPTILNTLNIGGFAKATDETYQPLLDIVKYMNIDLSTYYG
jgi:phosphonate transport system substrate-binding protein